MSSQTQIEMETEYKMVMDKQWETGWEIEGAHIKRLEVFNMCFDYDARVSDFYSSNSLGSASNSNIISCYSNNEAIELPGHFRGRIFVGDPDACEEFEFIEIYNSDTVGSVYVDLPKEMQDDSDSSQESSKRKIGGSISDSENSQKRAKQNNGDSTFGDTEEMQFPDGFPKSSGTSTINLPHTGPNEEEEEMQVAHEFSKSSGNLVNLPLTGPNEGMILDESFLLVIHKHTGNSDKEEQYEREAYKEYSYAGYVRPDDVGAWRALRLSSYDTPFEFHLYNDFRKLKMNCIVMENTKVVDVGIKWCMPTSHICGEISVSCDKFVGNKCSLIQTPQNKFVMAKEGEFIKLCRFSVAIPYSSDFTVKARLHDPNNALLVNESVSFPFVQLYNKDPKNLSYKTMLPMKGITDGHIEVAVFMYL